jgi:hypothetical protein
VEKKKIKGRRRSEDPIEVALKDAPELQRLLDEAQGKVPKRSGIAPDKILYPSMLGFNTEKGRE